jgi:hypothetical protein
MMAQFGQQGPKLVGFLSAGSVAQGSSIALSADGNTAMVGGPSVDAGTGVAWVYIRSADVWSEQDELVGTGAAGNAMQGTSVALSADGNTAIVGGPGDNDRIGAAWVFTRSGGVWSQQGLKLVGTGATINTPESTFQGYSVALSADGNTAVVSGTGDNSGTGAVWVYTRSGGVWYQEGPKLVGTGGVGISQQQGYSVTLSADGNTAIVGGPIDNNEIGAAWVFTRGGGVWTQQGLKLVGPGAVGEAEQGSSVALSADGNTALVGGWADDSDMGAAWVFTRSGTVWNQQGGKLVGTGAVGEAEQGSSVALSADGNTAIVGGPNDNNRIGAAWVYTRSGAVWMRIPTNSPRHSEMMSPGVPK